MRIYVIDDVKYINKILFELKEDLFNKLITIEQLDELANKYADSAEFIVVNRGGKDIGCVAIYCNDMVHYQAYISMIVVKMAYQKKGIGTGLLKEAIKIAGEKGMRKVILEVARDNDIAQAFYIKQGFSQIRKTQNSIFFGMEVENAFRNER